MVAKYPGSPILPFASHEHSVLRGKGQHLTMLLGRPTETALSPRADRLPVAWSVLSIVVLFTLSWAAVAAIVMLFV